jgi:vancomycin resistance protein YoaR
VCQVSTTLYNAALKSGLQITEFHPHSLRVSYVPPSRDAMVSSSSDLRFFNARPHAVKVKTHMEKNALKISIFGQKDGYRYEIISNIVGEIPPPPPVIKKGEKEEILREEKVGIESESFLEIYQSGKLVSRKRLRKDRYLPTQGIFVKKI